MNAHCATITRHDLVEAAERVDPLPASITRLLTLANSENSSMSDLGEVIHYDPILTVDVLRQANSARSAVRDPISEVSAAVARLGTAEVLSIAMKRAVHGRMTVALPAYGLDAHDLWRHSLSAAIAAETISELSTIRVSGHASTAALLHEFGKLIIAKALPKPVADELSYLLANDPRPLSEIERALLGTDHGEVGATAVRAWDLPMSLQIALTNYHSADQTADTLTHVVAASHAIADSIPEGTSADRLGFGAVASLNQSGVVDSLIPSLLDRVAERYEHIVHAYE